jgi:flagellar motility protein MotE (MotC chaperone)
MRKGIVVIQILIFLLFLAKISAVGGFMQKIENAGASLTSLAMAEPSGKGAYKPPLKDIAADSLQKERDLASSLQKRNADLDGREAAIKAEEQKLSALKKEITDKIDVLRKLEEQLTAKLEADKTVSNRKYKDLAKVYEATPPERAGAMLERMDIQTAAAITMNMKRDKAGIIWGYINPQKAVEITREITRAGRFVQDEKPATPAQ